MDIKTGFFYLFAAVLLFAAFRVVTARNPVHAALFLVLAFFQASGIWVLLKAEFLAITLVLVYVGAVMVLFLFVVMMLDIKIDRIRQGFWSHFPLAATLGAVVALEIIFVVLQGSRLTESAIPAAAVGAVSGKGNTFDLGRLIYTDYLLPLEIAAAILLVAMIAAIALTLRERKDSKYQDPSAQIRVKARDRVQIVKVAPYMEPVAESAPEVAPVATQGAKA